MKFLISQMKRVRRIGEWAFQTWPVTIPIVTLTFWHLLSYSIFPAYQVAITKWSSALMQIVGGAIILWSINANFVLLRGQSLWRLTIAYFRRFPWSSRPGIARVTGVQANTSAGNVTASITRDAVTIEERLSKIEIEIFEMRSHVERQVVEAAKRDQKLQNLVCTEMAKYDQRQTSLELRIQDIGIGGFRGQLMGVLLACSGAILSALV